MSQTIIQTHSRACLVLGLGLWAASCTQPVEPAATPGESAALSLPAGGDKKDWPMALYDVVASGHNARENQIGPDNVGQLEVKWRFDESVAGHEVGPIHASPVVSGNKVYVGSNLGRFYALNRDGQLLWEYLPRQPNAFLAAVVVPSPIGSPIEAVATPIVGAAVLPRTHPLVIFGDLDGSLYALDRETGAEVWVKERVDAHPLGGIVGNSLLLAGDTLIVGFASIENLGLILGDFGYQCCTHRGFVAAFDVATGAEKWRFDTLAVDELSPLPPEFAPYAFGPSGADIWGQPTYDEETNTVFVGTGQNFSPGLDGGGSSMSDSVIALDADTGGLKWVYQATENDVWTVGVPSPDADGNYFDQDFGDSPKIYDLPGVGKVVGLGQKSGEYHVIDAFTGEMITRTAHVAMANPLGGFQNLGAMANGMIYQHGLDRIGPPVASAPFFGTVMALSPDGLDVLWRVDKLLSPLAGGLAVANDVLYFQSPAEEPTFGSPPQWALYALDAATGAELNRLVFDGRALSSPVVSRGRIFLGDGNTAVAELGVDESGGLICLGLPDDD